jgi:hypothetical protein
MLIARIAVLLLLGLAGISVAQDQPLAWRSAPPLTELFPESELWSTRTIPFAELAEGVKAVPGRHGGTAGRWADHPRFPTIHTTMVRQDWTGSEALVLAMHSSKATGERILVGALCDNPLTHAKDFRVVAFRVDWTGWRDVALPLERFAAMGEPLGWDQVTGLYLFTKAYHWQPHPATELVLDGLRLGNGTSPAEPVALPKPAQVAGVEVVSNGPMYDGSWLNHPGPEVADPGPLPVEFSHQPYFKAERATQGYFPRFVPGMVNFDPKGRPWILAAGYMLQTCDPDGQWQTIDLLENVIAPYVKSELGFARVSLANKGQLNEACVRFDAAGDAYVLVTLNNPDGNWRTRTGLLLHGRNGMRDWTVYRLPYYMARFEQLTGHNPEALAHPPVILITRYHAPNESFLLVPEKQADGSLVLPEMVEIGSDTIGFLPHSGEASQALSLGSDIYVVYGRMAVLPGRKKEDGVPAFIVRYSRTQRTLSEPVFLGYGGRNALDNHNWPTIAADSKGILHVIINGHHDAFVYVHSLEPRSIERWSEPVKVSAGTTYAGLLVGPDDTLYSVTRCSEPGYYFRLALHRKRPGQEWEQQHLIQPSKPYYHVWYHKLSIEPRTGRLFLAYFAQTGQMCLFRDELEAFVYQRPDLAAGMLGAGEEPKFPVGTYCGTPRKYAFYGVPGGEPGLLVSPDGGDTWHLGTTRDFLSTATR